MWTVIPWALSPSFAPLFNLGAFFVGTALSHVATAHISVAFPFKRLLSHSVAMVLSPVSSGIGTPHGIVLYTRRAASNVFIRGQFAYKLQDAISAGAIAIWIPSQFACFIPQGPLGWQQVEEGTPIASRDVLKHLETGDGADRQSVLFVIPRTSRVIDNRYDRFRLSSNSSKSGVLFGLTQLLWSVYTGYIQYDLLIRDQGLSSPFLITFPFIHMNFINLLANLVEGSYPYITVLSAQRGQGESGSETRLFSVVDAPAPARISSRDRNSGINNEPLENTPVSQGPPIDNSGHQQDSAGSQIDSQSVTDAVRFANWLNFYYPGISFDEVPSLEDWVFIAHHLSATIVLLFWIGILTGFQKGPDNSQWFILLPILLDPLLPVVVTILLRLFPPRSNFVRQAVLGGERVICWSFYIGGWLVCFKVLYSLYSGVYLLPIVLTGTGA